jgi:SAM-dependent methyltransferase
MLPETVIVQHRCPICQATDSFIPFNGRELARCSNCLCVERNRLMWLALGRMGLPRPGTRVLHFAPELGIASRLAATCGEGYHACDISPERYKSKHYTVHGLDLCTDLVQFADASFDLIIHNHVLEHLACDVTDVLAQLERILAPGGVHLFSVPIRGERTTEDISPLLTPEERKKRFGQEDHMRLFGREELPEQLRALWKQENVLFDFGPDFDTGLLARAAIPEAAVTGVNGNTLFCRRKPVI